MYQPKMIRAATRCARSTELVATLLPTKSMISSVVAVFFALLLSFLAPKTNAAPDLFPGVKLPSSTQTLQPKSFFEENYGQDPRGIAYDWHGGGVTAYFRAAAVQFDLGGSPSEENVDQDHRIAIEFAGASKSAQLTGKSQLRTRINYLVGTSSKMWRQNLPTYAALTTKNLYPGIDLTYYTPPTGAFEYDLTLEPGADPSAILSIRMASAISKRTDRLPRSGH